MKRIALLLILPWLWHAGYAITGKFFNVNASETNHSVDVNTTVPNRTYDNVSITLNTSGYLMYCVNSSTWSIPGQTCLFPANNTQITSFPILGLSGTVNVTLCLNGIGKLTCQQFDVVTQSSLFKNAYLTDPTNNKAYWCVETSAAHIECQDAGVSTNLLNYPSGITINPNQTSVYIANGTEETGTSNYFVTQCAIDPATHLLNGSCVILTDPTFDSPANVTINAAGTYAYVTNPGTDLTGTTVSVCPILAGGSFDTCTTYNGSVSGSGTALFSGVTDIALNETFSLAYVTNYNSSLLYQCTVTPSSGALTDCVAAPFAPFTPTGITIDPVGRNVYTVSGINAFIYQCPIDQDTGSIGECISYNLGQNARFRSVAVNEDNTLLYATSIGSGEGFAYSHIFECPIITVNQVSEVGACTIPSGIDDAFTIYGIALLD